MPQAIEWSASLCSISTRLAALADNSESRTSVFFKKLGQLRLEAATSLASACAASALDEFHWYGGQWCRVIVKTVPDESVCLDLLWRLATRWCYNNYPDGMLKDAPMEPAIHDRGRNPTYLDVILNDESGGIIKGTWRLPKGKRKKSGEKSTALDRGRLLARRDAATCKVIAELIDIDAKRPIEPPCFGWDDDPDFPKWLVVIAWEVDKLVRDNAGRTRFANMCCSLNRANHYDGGLIPIRKSPPYTLVEKYTTLAAVHDAVCRGVESIVPPSSDLDDFLGTKALLPYTIAAKGVRDGELKEVDEPVLERFIEDVRKPLANKKTTGTGKKSGALRPLTDRQETVLRMSKSGFKVDEIACRLEISKKAVYRHLSLAKSKLSAGKSRSVPTKALPTDMRGQVVAPKR